MRKFSLIIILIAFGCNMSDREYELPAGYVFEREGLYANIVLKNNNLIIEHSAIDFSYNDKYVMFVFDTLTESPKNLNPKNLFYLIHDIKKNTLSERLDFNQYEYFIKSKKIKAEFDLTLRDYNSIKFNH